MRRVAEADADVGHGHGAKGSAYPQLSFRSHKAARACTPHGGSLRTLTRQFYLATERILMPRGDLGELRPVNGVDMLFEAIALMHREGRPVTATLVANGPDR